MSLETYWLAVPLVGIALTVPMWVWLVFTRRAADRPAVSPVRHRVADALTRLADTLEAEAEEEAERKRRSGEEPDLFSHHAPL